MIAMTRVSRAGGRGRGWWEQTLLLPAKQETSAKIRSCQSVRSAAERFEFPSRRCGG